MGVIRRVLRYCFVVVAGVFYFCQFAMITYGAKPFWDAIQGHVTLRPPQGNEGWYTEIGMLFTLLPLYSMVRMRAEVDRERRAMEVKRQ